MAVALAKRGRPVRFLGKKEVFDAPVVGQIARAMGGIRVERGIGLGRAAGRGGGRAEAGEVVALMPQGTIPRLARRSSPPPRRGAGAAKLAAMTGAPVIPVGLWGTEKVWPRSERLPTCWPSGTRPPSPSRSAPPSQGLTGESIDDDTKRIMKAIVAQLPPEARKKKTRPRTSSAEPSHPGYEGDPNAEDTRRPGTD